VSIKLLLETSLLAFQMNLFETRKHSAEFYPSLEHTLEKYRQGNTDGIFIHFSEDFTDSANQTINTIGINVKQDYSNPFGVYVYPITQLADFKIKAPFAYIIKSNSDVKHIPDITKLSHAEYSDCIDVIFSKFPKNRSGLLNLLKECESGSRNKTHGGVLFYFIYIIAMTVANGGTEFIDDYDIDKSGLNVMKEPNTIQTHIWRKWLGYHYICDYGAGVIHPNEPAQCVFFTKQSYKVIDVVKNITGSRRDQNVISNQIKYPRTNNNGLYSGGIDKLIDLTSINLKIKDFSADAIDGLILNINNGSADIIGSILSKMLAVINNVDRLMAIKNAKIKLDMNHVISKLSPDSITSTSVLFMNDGYSISKMSDKHKLQSLKAISYILLDIDGIDIDEIINTYCQIMGSCVYQIADTDGKFDTDVIIELSKKINSKSLTKVIERFVWYMMDSEFTGSKHIIKLLLDIEHGANQHNNMISIINELLNKYQHKFKSWATSTAIKFGDEYTESYLMKLKRWFKLKV